MHEDATRTTRTRRPWPGSPGAGPSFPTRPSARKRTMPWKARTPGCRRGREVGSPAHDQWLLDEALAETFPASDPIPPSQPPRRSD